MIPAIVSVNLLENVGVWIEILRDKAGPVVKTFQE